jgi:vitellogenic carboxypeptidase-like protein
MNLKGLIIGSGYTDPINQNQYGDFLFNLGLIDEGQKSQFYQKEKEILNLIQEEEWKDATRVSPYSCIFLLFRNGRGGGLTNSFK